MPDKIDFVLVTLADPTAPEGTVQLIRLPALVQALHEDKSADLTVFANAPVTAIKGGPVFLLEKIPLDVINGERTVLHQRRRASCCSDRRPCNRGYDNDRRAQDRAFAARDVATRFRQGAGGTQ